MGDNTLKTPLHDGEGQFGNPANPAIDVFGDQPAVNPVVACDVVAPSNPATQAPVPGQFGDTVNPPTDVRGNKL